MKPVIIFFLFHIQTVFCQKSINFSLVPIWQGEAFVLDSIYELPSNQHVSIEVLKFYISGLIFLYDDEIVFREDYSYHLMDAAIPESFKFNLLIEETKKINKIRFQLGIDSITNISGAMGGDLDPTKGMYWTWQSGYINVKLEGKSSLCASRNNAFIFHLGGYLKPFDECKTIELPIVIHNNTIVVNFDVYSTITSIDLAQQNHIMSPSADAKRLLGIVAQNIKL
ncbi:MAG: hypothetical protein IPO92_10610 [Saprospiraceae bacterium]|nr:hypothetical protein [Saprospiraceae bacterium]